MHCGVINLQNFTPEGNWDHKVEFLVFCSVHVSLY